MEIRRKKYKVGIVVSDKMTKTRVVRVERIVRHARFKKFLKIASKFYAHDEEMLSKVGDRVEIVESRPLSSLKRWRVTKVVESFS